MKKLAGMILLAASWSIVLPADEYRTPRAGEGFAATLFGRSVTVLPRDRTTTNALDLGLLFIPDGPDGKRVNPFASVLIWRNWNDGQQRLRALVVGIYDQIRYDALPWRRAPIELVATFDNLTPPFDRSEYVEGKRIRSEELRRYQMRAGFGIGVRGSLAPFHQDNHLEAALTYEPGYLSFDRGEKTDPAYIVPTDTYEGRVHLRLRLDQIERNLLEFPHTGVAAGLDAVHARRDQWDDWGGPILGFESGREGKEWNALSVYAVAAFPAFVRSDRHRFVTSFYGGKMTNGDRFSAFRLGGGPTTADWEALSRVVLPAGGFEEFFSNRYALLNLEYRYEMLFFAYLRIRGTLAQVDRLRFDAAGAVVSRIEPMNALSIGVTTGFFARSQFELAYSYNFGILRERGGVAKAGDGAILVHWSKKF